MMKNNVPCEIIEDLLPSYIDDILSDTSKAIVSEHLEGCDRCKKVYENMKEDSNKKEKESIEEEKNIIRKVKKKMDRKKKMIALVGIIAILLIGSGLYACYEIPMCELKLGKGDGKVEVEIKEYSFSDLKNENKSQYKKEVYTDDAIRSDMNDDSKIQCYEFTDDGMSISISDNAVEKLEVANWITYKSDKHIRDAKMHTAGSDEDGKIIEIEGFYTTLLGNNTLNGDVEISKMLELGKIKEVRYKGEVIWRNDNK